MHFFVIFDVISCICCLAHFQNLCQKSYMCLTEMHIHAECEIIYHVHDVHAVDFKLIQQHTSPHDSPGDEVGVAVVELVDAAPEATFVETFSFRAFEVSTAVRSANLVQAACNRSSRFIAQWSSNYKKCLKYAKRCFPVVRWEYIVYCWLINTPTAQI